MVGAAVGRFLASLLAILVIALVLPGPAAGQTERLRLIATTTLESSGFLNAIVPQFEAATGLRVETIIVGTGQAHDLARRREGDVVLTHDPAGERALVAEGVVSERRPVMTNHFVIAGPADDPAGIRSVRRAEDAFARIATSQAGFISRGDDSGTHRVEQRIWQAAGLEPESLSRRWYRPVGQGAGAALRIAAQLGAYVLVDSATLAAQATDGLDLLLEPEPQWSNAYAVMMVSAERHPAVNQAAAEALIDWLTGPAGQAAISTFRIGGAAAFSPAADGG
ncbi:MAG: substrate-binding domain-containing protein [Alphaproteobacteria bacterium]